MAVTGNLHAARSFGNVNVKGSIEVATLES